MSTFDLTAEQARAIRNATAICFDHDSDGARIRAITRGPDYRHETTTVIPLRDGMSSVSNYGPHPASIGYRDWFYTCFAMVMSAQHDSEWQTVARKIKAGTEIGLRWVRGNSSPVTEEAGLVVDHLTVTLQNGRTVDHYRVATFIGLDNSARMVRVSGNRA